MAQFFRVSCPNCRRELKIQDDFLNRRVACKFCQNVFRPRLEEAQAVAGRTAPPPGATAPAAAEPAGRRVVELEVEVQRSRAELEARDAEYAEAIEQSRE